MAKIDCSTLVKTDFDFGWKAGSLAHPTDVLAYEYQKGDILDVGCGTCRLYRLLNQRGWAGRYVGIDRQRYEGFQYPSGVKLIIGDASICAFPATDTVILYNLLEHVADPCALLGKALRSCRANVLLYVPKRNEALWEHGVVEYHQLDKTHQHCGFSKEEVHDVVRLSGGKVQTYKELSAIDATIGTSLWNNRIPKGVVLICSKLFSSKTFYSGIWSEVVRR